LSPNLKGPHRRRFRTRPDEPVAQRQRERTRLDFELVPRLRRKPVAEGQGGGPEEMDVNVARAAELRIFELVPLEIGKAVAHVRLSREEGLLPDDRPIAPDSAHAFDMLWRRTNEKLGPERRLPKLRVG